MSEIQLLRYQLIAAIMDISDTNRLRFLYQKAQPPKPQPLLNIPIMEVKSGVSLDEIRNSQIVKRIDFEEHMKRVAEVEWEQPLIETLKSLD